MLKLPFEAAEGLMYIHYTLLIIFIKLLLVDLPLVFHQCTLTQVITVFKELTIYTFCYHDKE